MSITVVEFEAPRETRQWLFPRDLKYPPITIRAHVSGLRMCEFAGSTVVSSSPEKVETLVMEIVDGMRRNGMYVDPDKTIG